MRSKKIIISFILLLIAIGVAIGIIFFQNQENSILSLNLWGQDLEQVTSDRGLNPLLPLSNAPVQLQITSLATSTATRGDYIDLTFSIKNTGSVAIDQLKISDNLPSGLIYIGSKTSTECTLVPNSDNDIECFVGTINPDQYVTVILTFSIEKNNECNSNIYNVAKISGPLIAQVNAPVTTTRISCESNNIPTSSIPITSQQKYGATKVVAFSELSSDSLIQTQTIDTQLYSKAQAEAVVTSIAQVTNSVPNSSSNIQTSSSSPSPRVSQSPTPSVSRSPSPSPTRSPSPSPSKSPTPSVTPTNSSSPTPTPSRSPVPTVTPRVTPTPTVTPSPSPISTDVGTVAVRRVLEVTSQVFSEPTTVKIDSVSTTTNFATIKNVAVGAKNITLSLPKGFRMEAATCTFPTGSTECISADSAYTQPSCTNTTCTIPITVTKNSTSKVVVKFHSIVPLVNKSVSVVTMGTPEVVFNYATEHCTEADRLGEDDRPDTSARAYRDASGKVVLMANSWSNRRFVGTSLNTVKKECASVYKSHKDTTYDNFKYNEWISGVYSTDGNKVYGVVHSEWYGFLQNKACPAGNSTLGWANAMTLVSSTDGGKNFALVANAPQNYIIRRPELSWSSSFPCTTGNTTIYGSFQPGNIFLKDGYYYMFFKEQYQSAAFNPTYSVGVCLMRTKNLGTAHAWEVYTSNGFVVNKTAKCKYIDPVDLGLNAIRDSISFNYYLNAYVMVGVTTSGGNRYLSYSTSEDLFDWTPAKRIMQVDSGFKYASLLDPTDTSRNFEKSGQEPYIYYSYIDASSPLNGNLMRQKIRFNYALASTYDETTVQKTEYAAVFEAVKQFLNKILGLFN